ncbi:MAG: histidine--tRNA ligase [Verrucomicrobiota bacterium]
MAEKFKTLPGFRDFFPEVCAERNYVFQAWREVARRYGFHEYEGPLLEPTDLYKKKSGDEIVSQLFHFIDKGEREVTLRPELTPTLARMAAARQRDYKKPLRWFSIGRFFRYEKQQRGRLREFYQWNVDILGEESPAADAELVALAIDTMRELGFTSDDFCIRLSNRDIWLDFLDVGNVESGMAPDFLQIIDKMEREKPEATASKLEALGTSRTAVDAFIEETTRNGHPLLEPVINDLASRGMGDFVRIDLSIVRGLAYYTGTVFEVFDVAANMRAVAGGGRYDQLVGMLSGGGADIPASGFAMGDVVITDFVKTIPQPNSQLLDWIADAGSIDVFVVIADEDHRNDALGLVQRLRQSGRRVDFPLQPAKVGKQFQSAEHFKAKAAVVIGSEFPAVKVKNLRTRDETETDTGGVPGAVAQILAESTPGPLLA